MSIISAKNLSVRFGNVVILDDVSFDIARGEYVGLIGPNGAGKSTLIKTLLGLITPSNGTVTIANNVTLSYVPQHYTLPTSIPLSVTEVLRMNNLNSSITPDDISNALNAVNLDDTFITRNFHQLSGGQKQRVIIARALISQPDIIFFDEPVSGVDLSTKIHIYELLGKLNKEKGITIFFVSHDIERVVSMCDHILCLNKTLHTGCHPMDFATDVKATCITPQSESLRPIHHHHKIP